MSQNEKELQSLMERARRSLCSARNIIVAKAEIDAGLKAVRGKGRLRKVFR